MSTEKLISGISRIDKHKYLNTSHEIKYMFFSMSRTAIPHTPPMMVAISRLLNELYREMDGHILAKYTLKGIYEN